MTELEARSIVVLGPPLSSKTTLLLALARARATKPRSLLITPDATPQLEHSAVLVAVGDTEAGDACFLTFGGGVFGDGPWLKLLSTAETYLLTVPAFTEPSLALEWVKRGTALAGRAPGAIAITKTDLASASAANTLRAELGGGGAAGPPMFFTTMRNAATMLRPLEYLLAQGVP